MRPSRLSTALAAAIRPSSGTWSGSLLPPVKLYLARPVQRAAGAGSPAGSSGAKSKWVAVDMDVHSPFDFLFEKEPLAFRHWLVLAVTFTGRSRL